MDKGLLSYEAAAALVLERAARIKPEELPGEPVALQSAAGRILAAPLFSDRDQPPFDRSARDGYACRAEEAGQHDFLRIAGSTRAGEAPAGPLPRESAWEIMTGAPVPTGADSVIMVEHTETSEQGVRLLPAYRIVQGENIVRTGAEARAGQELLAAGTPLEPAQIALAAACGSAAIRAFARPRVAILCTGDELVPVEADPAPGQIRNSNGPMLEALVANAGGFPILLPVAADAGAALDESLAAASDAEMLLITGGVSAGKFDLVEDALSRAGALFHFTGVRIQPGKPLVFGEMPRAPRAGERSPTQVRSQIFFGLPGNPISSAVTFHLFATPVIAALGGSRKASPRFALARLATEWKGKSGLTRFLPAHLDFGLDFSRALEARLVPWQGSGDLAAFAHSNCFVVIPDNATQLDAGAIVRILLA